MKYLITEKVIGFVARKFDGKKTLIGGVGMILLGLVGLLGHFWPDMGLPVMEFDAAAGYVVGGFAALGLGGKLEKLTNSDDVQAE